MVTHHSYGTRVAEGVSRGFSGHPSRASLNHAAEKYNQLPAVLRKEVSYTIFKRKLKTWVQANIELVYEPNK